MSDAAIAAWILGTLVVVCFCAVLFAQYRDREQKPQGPVIPLDSPCPACGHRVCTLEFKLEQKKVYRKCKVCGCQVGQSPVYPALFENAK